MAGLSIRAIRIRRLLRGLSLEELVQVLDEALKEILGDDLELTLEHIIPDDGGATEPVPWAAKQVTPHSRNANANADGILFGRTVSFTGDLASISRDDAARAVADLGGVPHTAVTRQSDVLVVGIGPGDKLEKARRYGSSGQIIEIIDEQVFLRYLAGATFTSEGRNQLVANAEIQAAARLARSKPPSPLINRNSAELGTSYKPQLLNESQALAKLTCRACGEVWTRQSTPGRPPSICPDCRASIRTQ